MEKGLPELINIIRDQYPITKKREEGWPLPTPELLRELRQKSPIMGPDSIPVIASDASLIELAELAQPTLIFDKAGIETITIDDRQEASILRWQNEEYREPPLQGSGRIWVDVEVNKVSEKKLRFRLALNDSHTAPTSATLRRLIRQTLEDELVNGNGESGKANGLIHQASGSVTFGGATPNYAEAAQMVERLGDADGDLGCAVWLMHPSTAAKLAQTNTNSSIGSFVLEPPALARWSCVGLPVIISTAIPKEKTILLDPCAAQVVMFGPPQLVERPRGLEIVYFCNLAVSEPSLVVVGNT